MHTYLGREMFGFAQGSYLGPLLFRYNYLKVRY